ncbi:uncharacterized protein LOC135140199 [Zophobas morio]|uniref:uncharacterized protein LOC135140199 n=1 Tax=Zophobas morio TaxID=2755281 RepID=UPI003082C6B3
MESDVASNAASLKFKKRSGTTDRGKDYEHFYIANLVLKLISDDTVQNFYLSSNDDKFGIFDDVVVEVQYINQKETHLYAVQLKQSKNKVLRSRDFTAPKGNFSFVEYLKDYNENLKTTYNSINVVLFTNCNAQISDNLSVDFKKQEFVVTVSETPQNDLLSSCAQGSCYTFATENEQNDFFQHFYLYTGQADADQMEKETFKMFSKEFSGDKAAFQIFLRFITEWSKLEGNKHKLDKKWMQEMIALSLLSAVVKPLKFAKDVSVSAKGKTVRTAVSKFHVTALDNDDYISIKNLWADVADAVETLQINQVRKKYDLMLDYVSSRNHLYQEDKEISKILWLLEKCPLVVEVSLQTQRAIALCPERSFIILGVDETRTQDIFKNVSDLRKHEEIFKSVLNNFTYSLEGQREVCLNELLQWNQELATMITTSNLVQTIDRPLLIGSVKEVLPPCHVTRTLSKILIDVQFLEAITNSVIVVTEVEDLTAFVKLHLKEAQKHHLDENTDEHVCLEVRNNVVHLYKGKLSQQEFRNLCTKTPAKNKCHRFKYVDEKVLEWIESTNNLEELKTFRLSGFSTHSVHESQLVNDDNKTNIICANPGMGKSTLMKNLKISTRSSIWTILISARNHALYFRKRGGDVDGFFNYILDENCRLCHTFDAEVFRTLLEKDQVQLIWDGLDEVSDRSLEVILTLIDAISNKGVRQWITARTNVRNVLEDRFHIFSRDIKPFNQAEQQIYVQERLDLSKDDLRVIFHKIKVNVEMYSNNDILGIPLQIYMLTELFKQNSTKYADLLNTAFTLLDLYENFIHEKFEIYFNEKRQSNRKIDTVDQDCEDEMEERVNFYKELAYYVYLESKYRVIVKRTFECLISFNNFLEKIKQERDPVGLISNVTIENVPEFSHNSYGEYFAALYLFDTNREKAKQDDFISNKKFNNIRFFLDLMLCKNSKAHVAVLCRNCIILDQCTEEDLRCRDLIKRSALEVACMYNEKRSCVQVVSNFYGKLRIGDTISDLNGKLRYSKILKMCPTGYTLPCNVKKTLLLLPFLIPLLHSANFSFSNELFATMLYYAIEFDYVVVFRYIDNTEYLRDIYENFDPQSLLSMTVRLESLKCLEEFLLKKQYSCIVRQNLEIPLEVCSFDSDEFFSLLIKQEINLNKFVCLVCRAGTVENLEYLRSKDISVDVEDTKGQTSMHYAFEHNSKHSFEIGKFLVDLGMSVNSTDADGLVPLHYALRTLLYSTFRELKSQDFNAVKLLIDNGATHKVPQVENFLPIYHPLPGCETLDLLLDETTRDTHNPNVVISACKIDTGSLSSLYFLKDKGFKFDVPDVSGYLPIHYACKLTDVDTVKLLTQNSETVNTPDPKGRISIHFACKNINHGEEIVEMLCDMRVSVHAKDANGCLPIHHACRNENPDLIQLLIDRGAKIDVPDGYGQFPIHDACGNEVYALEFVKLLIENKTVLNVADINGDTPIHIACTNIYVDYKMIKLFVNNGGNVNATNLDGEMPIHHACNYEITVKRLNIFVDNGADLNAVSGKGRMPIHHACANAQDSKAIEFLVTNGAKVDAADSNDKMPIHYASGNERYGFHIAKYLTQSGAKIDVPDADGLLPIHYACASGCDRTVKLLTREYGKENPVDDNGQTLMHHACKNRVYGIEIVDILINESHSLNSVDKNNRLPIHYACENPKQGFEIVKLLTDQDVDLHSSDINGLTLMHIACRNQQDGFDIVKLLLDKNVKLDVIDVEGRLPIHYASENNGCGYGIVKLLIEKGTRVDVPDTKGRLPIHYACMNGNLKIVEALMNQNSKTRDATDVDGRMPIHFACGNFKFGTVLVKLLLDKGTKLDIPDINNKMPIHYACESGSLETVKIFLDEDINFQATDADGRLPIHYASGNKFYPRGKKIHSGFQITNLLINRGLNIHVADKNQKMPIHYACQTGSHVTAKLLLDQGAKVDTPDITGRFPLHYVGQNDSYTNFKTAKYLLDHGADLNVTDSTGRTPLHYACELQYDLLLKFLIFKGAKLDVPDIDGVMPIHCACAKGYRQYVTILTDKGVKDDVADAHGRTPLHYACQNKENGYPIVKLLLERGVNQDVVDVDGVKPVDYARKNSNFKVERLMTNAK